VPGPDPDMQSEETEPGAKQPAPGELRIIQAFINSVDIEGGTEKFESPGALSSWLYGHGLTRTRRRMSWADLEQAREVRELLRAMALANNGRALDPAVLSRLNKHLDGVSLVSRFETADSVVLEGVGSGLEEALGRIVAVVHAEMVRGRWPRLKACARDVCHWVFYDHSRNQTGTWCTMAICGARTKVQAYYRRRRRAGLPVRSS
jgi:predicted RNA-binding Zn ribbon-like protein